MLRCTRLCAMLTALSLIGADTTKPRPTLFYRIALLLLMMLMVGVDVDRIDDGRCGGHLRDGRALDRTVEWETIGGWRQHDRELCLFNE
ncbi:hypothetical protein Tcan_18744 [Toxocara canis]|uniref:Secreted protein n=1 Tax=Toxocara canis TaxID=6265 RepID=A0A0B2VUQ9_TOXCA|nr:hypothetical protein Tcan_18744 [Toxocara canis]